MIKQIWKRFKQNYDIIIGFVFFISYRFLFTYLLWKGRGVPPEPDDAYFYLATAKIFPSIGNFEDFRLLPFSAWLNLISKFTNSNLEKAYEVNFYLGAPIMFFALYFLLCKIETLRVNRLLLILTLTLYSGSGSYHGFYWVAPSFYQLAAFFVILTFILIDKKASFLSVLLISLLFIFIHPTSIFLSMTFLIYAAVTFATHRKFFNKIFKNLIYLFSSISISYIVYFLIGKSYPHSDSPESFESISKLIVSFIRGDLNPSSFPTIQREYFSIFFFHPLSVLVYFLMLFFVLKFKKIQLLVLFLSTLILVFISSFLPYGWRTLSLLWPLTFLLIGYALISAFVYLKANLPSLKYIVLIPTVVFVFLAIHFNLIGVKSTNARNDYSWDRQCPKKLVGQSSFFYSHESLNAFVLHGLSNEDALLLSADNLNKHLEEGSKVVEIEPLTQREENLSTFEKFTTGKITRRYPRFDPVQSQNSWSRETIAPDHLRNYISEKNLTTNKSDNCGHFQIYSISRK